MLYSCCANFTLAAMMCLKRKKTYEGQIDKIAGARMTIDTQVSAIEGANVSLEAMNVMRMGAQTMKDIHKNMYDYTLNACVYGVIRLYGGDAVYWEVCYGYMYSSLLFLLLVLTSL